jgi:hypothetical protein
MTIKKRCIKIIHLKISMADDDYERDPWLYRTKGDEEFESTPGNIKLFDGRFYYMVNFRDLKPDKNGLYKVEDIAKQVLKFSFVNKDNLSKIYVSDGHTQFMNREKTEDGSEVMLAEEEAQYIPLNQKGKIKARFVDFGDVIKESDKHRDAKTFQEDIDGIKDVYTFPFDTIANLNSLTSFMFIEDISRRKYMLELMVPINTKLSAIYDMMKRRSRDIKMPIFYNRKYQKYSPNKRIGQLDSFLNNDRYSYSRVYNDDFYPYRILDLIVYTGKFQVENIMYDLEYSGNDRDSHKLIIKEIVGENAPRVVIPDKYRRLDLSSKPSKGTNKLPSDFDPSRLSLQRPTKKNNFYNVSDMKRFLKEMGLSSTGKKEDLYNRLVEASNGTSKSGSSVKGKKAYLEITYEPGKQFMGGFGKKVIKKYFQEYMKEFQKKFPSMIETKYDMNNQFELKEVEDEEYVDNYDDDSGEEETRTVINNVMKTKVGITFTPAFTKYLQNRKPYLRMSNEYEIENELGKDTKYEIVEKVPNPKYPEEGDVLIKITPNKDMLIDWYFFNRELPRDEEIVGVSLLQDL